MNPRYARVRPDMSVDEAISYLRRQARERIETIYYVYVLDAQQHLRGVVSFRELFAAPGEQTIQAVMHPEVVTVSAQLDQEAVSQLFAQHDLIALPVVDAEGRMKGIVTVDDIVDVVQEEATEDIHKLGGLEALDGPYLQIGFGRMVRKRAGWLSALFLGEMLTATAMGYYEHAIERAVVLALFIPLIISSGGNSGWSRTRSISMPSLSRQLPHCAHGMRMRLSLYRSGGSAHGRPYAVMLRALGSSSPICSPMRSLTLPVVVR